MARNHLVANYIQHWAEAKNWIRNIQDRINLRLGQTVQKRLPAIPPIDNERLKALNDKQSDALKCLNQLADDASLIGDSSARSRLLARIASLLWPYDETRARMLFKFAFFTVNQTRKLEMLLKNENAIIYGAGGSIGGAVARAFAREGATVCLVGRTLDTLDKVARELS